jgi:hypothetical protein
MPTSLAGEFVSCLKAGTRSRQTGLRSTLSSRFPLGWVAVSHVLHCSPSEDRQIDATVTARKPLLVCGGVCSGSLLREDPGDARNCHEQVAQAATRAGSARRPGAMERGRAPGAAAARLLARKRRAFQRKPLVGSGRAWHRPRPSRHRCLQRLLVRACCCPVEPKERANQRSVGRGLGVLRPAFELRGRLARELGCRSFQRGAQGFPLARGEVPELAAQATVELVHEHAADLLPKRNDERSHGSVFSNNCSHEEHPTETETQRSEFTLRFLASLAASGPKPPWELPARSSGFHFLAASGSKPLLQVPVNPTIASPLPCSVTSLLSPWCSAGNASCKPRIHSLEDPSQGSSTEAGAAPICSVA